MAVSNIGELAVDGIVQVLPASVGQYFVEFEGAGINDQRQLPGFPIGAFIRKPDINPLAIGRAAQPVWLSCRLATYR